MEKQSYEAINSVIQPFYRIRDKLSEPFMLISEAMNILKVTKRQLLYWDSKGMKLTPTKNKGRSWRKFSILDLFGFAILKHMRTFGLKLSQCNVVFDWLRAYLYDKPSFIYHFAEGEPIFLLLDIENNKIKHMYGGHDRTVSAQFLMIVNPKLPLSAGHILRQILETVKRKDFHVEFIKDETGLDRKAIFYIDDERIELMPSSEAFVILEVDKILNVNG